MFGMSSKEFWEDDPQLYWAYRIFYLKQKEVEIENQKYDSWLKGSMNAMATSIAINNGFSSQKKEFPKYEEMFTDTSTEKNNKKLTKKDIDKQVLDEFNAWARY